MAGVGIEGFSFAEGRRRDVEAEDGYNGGRLKV